MRKGTPPLFLATAVEIDVALKVAPVILCVLVYAENALDLTPESSHHSKGQYGPDSAYGGRRRGGRPYDDLSSYYSGGRGAEYNDSNFVFVDPHVLGELIISSLLLFRSLFHGVNIMAMNILSAIAYRVAVSL